MINDTLLMLKRRKRDSLKKQGESCLKLSKNLYMLEMQHEQGFTFLPDQFAYPWWKTGVIKTVSRLVASCSSSARVYQVLSCLMIDDWLAYVLVKGCRTGGLVVYDWSTRRPSEIPAHSSTQSTPGPTKGCVVGDRQSWWPDLRCACVREVYILGSCKFPPLPEFTLRFFELLDIYSDK